MRILPLLLTLLLLTAACSSQDGDQHAEQGDPDTQTSPGVQSQGLGLGGRPADSEEAGEESDDDLSAADGMSGQTSSQGSAPSGGSAAADMEAPIAVEPAPAPPEAPPAGGAAALTSPLPPERDEHIDQPIRPVSSTNPWVATAEDSHSTFGLDVDTISYTRIREALEHGYSLDPSEIRVEEVLNAFDFSYAADDGEVFTVHADGAVWPWSEDGDQRHLLRIGVTTSIADERQPADLVFVIDTSGSMSGVLPLVQDSLRILVDGLADGDTIAIVEYSDNARPLLDPTRVHDADQILRVIDRLETGGSTNLADGLTTGYRLAESAQREGRTSRVIILSDGIANVGATDPDAILDQIEDAGNRGVNLLTVGFGLDGFNDPLMEQLADRGDGFAAYIDTLDEAEELFGHRLTTTLQTVAVEARSQVEFNPDVVAEYRLIGYENRDIADDDFRDDSIDAGEIGAGHSVTAVYELDLVRGARGSLATVSLRWLDPESRDATETAQVINADVVGVGWEESSAGLRLAGAVTAWAEILRQSPYATDDLEGLAAEADRIAGALSDDRVDEWANLVQQSIG